MLPDSTEHRPIICLAHLAEPSNDLHKVFYTQCRVSFHDLYDHAVTTGRAGVLAKMQRREPVDLPNLMALEFRSGSARALLTEGHCSAQCILALGDDESCTCMCGGEFHGAMTDHPIDMPTKTTKETP